MGIILVRIEWNVECIIAYVDIAGIGTIRLNKYGDSDWYVETLSLTEVPDDQDGGYFFVDEVIGSSPPLADSALCILLDSALDAVSFDSSQCDCTEGKCQSLRQHAVRVHEENKQSGLDAVPD